MVAKLMESINSEYVLRCDPYADQTIDKISLERIQQQLNHFQVLVFDNIQPPSDSELISFANSFRQLGYRGVLDWQGQSLFHLEVDLSKDNYIFSRERVPLHWDGAFFEEPQYLMFYCDESEGRGGETFFVDSRKVIETWPIHAPFRLEDIELSIQCEKKVHYGGERTLPILGIHPCNSQPVLRLAESVWTERNPVTVMYRSKSDPNLTSKEIEEELMTYCYQAPAYAEHHWQKGQLLLANNQTLLHGRKSFSESTRRKIRRVQII